MASIDSVLTSSNSLHPKIVTTLRLGSSERPKDCHLDLVYELPASVFVDPYQLGDLETQLGKASIFGEHDLELPLEKVHEPRGSLVFIRLRSDHVTLPIHTRYQSSQSHTNQTILLKPPYAGWTCGDAPWPPIEHALLPRSRYPFARFIPLVSQRDTLTLHVPVGKIEDKAWVTFGTFCAVVLCTAWIARSLFLSVKKRQRTEAKGKRRKSD